MKQVFETCVPREEILKGELPEEAFAARLTEVRTGKAHPIYGDPVQFFRRTHPTEDLKKLLEMVLGRLSGKDPTANSVVRLETGFGGGKTHSLIALHHAVSGIDPSLVAALVQADRVPRKAMRVVSLVGTDLDPADGTRHQDGTVTKTLWGELAWQAGGPEAYSKVKGSDEAGTAPSTVNLDAALGPGPCLVLIDEIARYLRVASEHRLQVSTLDQQIAPFLHSLFELASSRKNLVVVMTLASQDDAYAQETEALVARLNELKKVQARSEQILKPVGTADLAPVLRTRLFESVDEAAGALVAQDFQTWYAALFGRGEKLPEACARPDYREALRNAYPFHPDLLNVLENKVSTLPGFQKTRGALRLLGLLLRRVWETRPPDCAILGPGHVDLSYAPIANDLTTRLQVDLAPAIRADIASDRPGDPAHAQAMDASARKAGQRPLATRVAQAIYLHSLSQGTPGCDPNELNLAVVQRGLETLPIERTAQDLLDKAWHLHLEGQRYRFKETPSLTKILASEVDRVTVAEAKQKLHNHIHTVYNKGSVLQAVLFPDRPEDLPDDETRPHLAILHFDSAVAGGGAAVPQLVERLYGARSSSGDYRRYPNHALFLVANEADVQRMVDTARRFEAIRQFHGDRERWRDLPEEQQQELKARRETSELELRMAITATYRHLYYPASAQRLQRLTLPLQDSTQVRQEQQGVLVAALQGAKKLVAPGDKPLAAAYVRDRVWPGQQESMTLVDFRRAFAAKPDLPIHLSVDLLREIVLDGVKAGVWGHWDDSRLSAKLDGLSTSPHVQFAPGPKLVTMEEAKRLDREGRKKAPPQPPVGPKPDPVTPPLLPPLVLQRTELEASGEPKRAFQQVFDQAKALDPRPETRRLTLKSRTAADLPRLAVAVSQWPQCTVVLDLKLEAEPGPGVDCVLEYRGPWDRYRGVLKAPAEELVRGGGHLEYRVTLQVELPKQAAVAADAPELADLVRALADLGVGPLDLVVHLEPEEALL